MITNRHDIGQWLKDEDEFVRPYLQAWKGENPYESIYNMKFGFIVMVISIVAAVLCAVFGNKAVETIGCFCSVFVFGLGFAGWNSARNELRSFSDAAVWCEEKNIPHYLLGKGQWTREDIGEVLRFTVPTIQSDILPLEKEKAEAHPFPKKTAVARKKHDERKARLVEEIRMISPMFNNFSGVPKPESEAFRLATEK